MRQYRPGIGTRRAATTASLGLLLLCSAVAIAQDQPDDGTHFVRVLSGQEHWVDYKGDGAKFGVKEAFILGDPNKPGPYVIRIKFPPGVVSSPHAHPELRVGTVIRGTWWTGTGEKFDPESMVPVPAGGMMVHPPGKVHYDGALTEETVVQMMGVGPSKKIVVDASKPGFTRVKK